MTLSPSILATLDDLADRHEELSALLGEAEVVSNRDKFTALSKEYSELEPIIERYRRIGALRSQIDDAQALLDDDDAEMRQLASDDRDQLRARIEALELEIKALLVPKDPHDDANVFLEIRAGTGGDEAAIFAGDLFRMYSRYAEEKRLAARDPQRTPRRTRRIQRDHQPHRRRARLQPAEVRVGRASRATRAADGIARAHSHVRMHRGDPAGSRRSRRHRHSEERPAHRHVSFVRRRRTAREQDRLRGASDAHSDRPRGGVSGRTLAAQEPRPGDVVAEGATARHGAAETAAGTGAVAPSAGRQRRSFRAHPHVQLSAGSA